MVHFKRQRHYYYIYAYFNAILDILKVIQFILSILLCTVSFHNQLFEVIKDKEGQDDDYLGSAVDFSEGNAKAVIEFTAAQSAIMESEKRVRIGIKRYGKMNSRVIFK